MLILSRHLNEDIVITLPDGTVIVVAVVKLMGDRCRIGIAAPVDIPVLRQELHDDNERVARLAEENL